MTAPDTQPLERTLNIARPLGHIFGREVGDAAEVLVAQESEAAAHALMPFLARLVAERDEARERVRRVEAVLSDHDERANEAARTLGIGYAPVVRIEAIRAALGGEQAGDGGMPT